MIGKGVFCYRNLNRKGVVWSVKSNRTGLVITRSTRVVLEDATLKVSKAGRERVLRDKRKNVHAGVSGRWVRGDAARHIWSLSYTSRWTRIKYNPYENSTFVRQDNGKPVTKAKYVVLDKMGAWACDVE